MRQDGRCRSHEAMPALPTLTKAWPHARDSGHARRKRRFCRMRKLLLMMTCLTASCADHVIDIGGQKARIDTSSDGSAAGSPADCEADFSACAPSVPRGQDEAADADDGAPRAAAPAAWDAGPMPPEGAADDAANAGDAAPAPMPQAPSAPEPPPSRIPEAPPTTSMPEPTAAPRPTRPEPGDRPGPEPDGPARGGRPGGGPPDRTPRDGRARAPAPEPVGGAPSGPGRDRPDEPSTRNGPRARGPGS